MVVAFIVGSGVTAMAMDVLQPIHVLTAFAMISK
jgi:hypothetical protein